MIWQDLAMAFLLALGSWGTWGMVVDGSTVVERRHSLKKAASALGLGLLQASVGLWVTAVVSVQYVAAFLLLAWLRSPRGIHGEA